MLAPQLPFLNKLSARLVASLLFVVLLAMLGMGLTAFLTERASLYNGSFSGLEAVLIAKSSEIQRWVDERNTDITFLAENRLHQAYFTEISQPDVENDLKEKSSLALRENLLSLTRTHPYYKQIDIANTDGIVKISTSDTSAQINQETFLGTIRKPDTIFTRDMYFGSGNEGKKIYMQFAHTLHGIDPDTGDTTDTVIGLVVMTIDVKESFFPMLENYQFLGETGEIVLGRNEGNETVVLNNLRSSTAETALVNRIVDSPDTIIPLRLAANGEKGVVETADRNQRQTLFAYSSLPNLEWGLVVKKETAEALSPLWSLLKWLSIISALLLACAAFFAIRLWRRIAEPIRYLTTAIDSVADGDLAVDVKVMNKDEMGSLAESFRDMLQSIRLRQIDLHYATKAVEVTEQENTQLVMQLRRLNTDLEYIVSDRTEELSVANSKLKMLDELKSKFISNVSHELRNPVASLKLYVNLLNKSNETNRERYLDAIGRQIDVLGDLVENVLDIAHLENDNSEIVLSPCDLKLIAQRVIDSNRPRAEAEGLSLTLTTCDEPVVVLGSATKLMQLLTNLVTNALNYTGEGSVSVEIGTMGQEAQVVVVDTGIGIPKEDMPHLFERFYRGHNVNELEVRGTGLGLGIVKEVVDLHTGRIMVESEEGSGTRFQIFLPLAANSYTSTEQIMVGSDVPMFTTE